MPIIDRVESWRVFFYANDHLPKHVHVILKGENRGAKIWLHDVSLAKNSMLRQHELKTALSIVKQNQQAYKEAYKEAWDEFFSN